MSYTIEFVFALIFMGITVGTFMGLIAVNKSVHPAVKWILGIIIAIAIGCAIGGLGCHYERGVYIRIGRRICRAVFRIGFWHWLKS